MPIPLTATATRTLWALALLGCVVASRPAFAQPSEAEGLPSADPTAEPPQPPPAATVPATPPAAPSPPQLAPDTAAANEAGGLSTEGTLGAIFMGMGGASALVGAILGLVALDQKSTLDETCVDTVCPPAMQDDVDSYNGMRTGSATAIWVGVALAVGGVAVLVTSPSAKPAPATASVQPYLGWGSVAVEGRF